MKKEKEGEALGENGFCDSCQFLPKSRDVVFSKAKKEVPKVYMVQVGTPPHKNKNIDDLFINFLLR